MEESFRNYLKWRFCQKLQTKYVMYFDEWVANVTEEQMAYFKEEMNRLSQRGIYKA